MDNLIINRPNYVSESEMVAVFAVALIMKRRRRRVIKPRIWSRSWVLQRQKQGAYANLCRELEVGDIDQRRIGQVDPPATELTVLLPLLGPEVCHLRIFLCWSGQYGTGTE